MESHGEQPFDRRWYLNDDDIKIPSISLFERMAY